MPPLAYADWDKAFAVINLDCDTDIEVPAMRVPTCQLQHGFGPDARGVVPYPAQRIELQQDAEYRRRANFALGTLAEPMLRFPTAFGNLLGCADMELYGATEVALIGERSHHGFTQLERAVGERYVPSLVLAGGNFGERSTIKLLEGRPLVDDKPTAYVCRAYTCDKPVMQPDALSDQLENAAKVGAAV